DELFEVHLEVLRAMTLPVLVEFLANLLIDFARRLLVCLGGGVLIGGAGWRGILLMRQRFRLRIFRGLRGVGRVMGATLFVDALLRVELLLFALGTAFFGFDYVGTQFAFGAEQAPVSDGEFGFFLFVRHDFGFALVISLKTGGARVDRLL